LLDVFNQQNAPPQSTDMQLETPQDLPLEVFDFGTEEATRVAQLLKNELEKAESAQGSHIDQIQTFRAIYELRVPDRDPAWEGAANYRTPLSRNKVDKVCAMLAAALDQDPFFSLRPRTARAEQIRVDIEEYLDARLDEIKIRDHIQPVLLETLITGTGITKILYETTGIAPNTVSQTKLEIVPIEDFFVTPIEISTLDKAFLVAHRFWMPFWELEQMFEDNIIHGDIEPLRNANATDEGNTKNQMLNDLAGHQTTVTGVNPGSNNVPIYECWWRDGGQMWVTWIHRSSGRILKHELNPFEHARAPFTLHKYWAKPNFLFGTSMVELLESTQLELDALTNARTDANSLAIGGLFLVEDGSKVQKWLSETGNTFAPGAQITVDTLEKPGIVQFNINGANPVSLQDQQLLFQFADKSTIPDSSLAQPLTNRDPTATEVNRDQSVVTVVVKAWLHCLHIGLRELGFFVMHNLHQFEVAPSVRITPDLQIESGVLEFLASDKTRTIKADEMFLSDFDLEVNGRETQTMQAERRAQFMLAFQVLMPVLQQLQGQQIADSRVYAILKGLLEINGIKNWEEYLGPAPQPMADLMHQMNAEAIVSQVQGALQGVQAGQPPSGGN
jgi:hypothetical protein